MGLFDNPVQFIQESLPISRITGGGGGGGGSSLSSLSPAGGMIKATPIGGILAQTPAGQVLSRTPAGQVLGTGGGGGGGFIEQTPLGMIMGQNGLDITGQGATDRALAAQTEATRQANETQKYMYDTTRKDFEPWRNAGVGALGQIQGEMPELTRSFSMSDFQADPGYQFRMSEGQKAIERSAAAGGGIQSGRTLKALTRFGQDTAAQEYQNAYNRFNNDQGNRFNRLSSLAGIGQTATGQMGQANQNYGNNVSQNYLNYGNAVGAANIAQANRTAGMIGQAATAGAMYFSDERLKTNVSLISKEDINELRATLKPYKFQYINEEFGEGEWVGVMAQDLQKSKLGRTVVVKNREGHLMIDSRKLSSLLLAMMAEG